MRRSAPARAMPCSSRRIAGSASGKMASAAGLLRGGGRPGRSLILFGLAALASAGLLLWAADSPVFAAAFLAGLVAVGGVIALRKPAAAEAPAAAPAAVDTLLLRAAL